MGREVRRVPANWEHPKNQRGDYIPLFGDSYAQRAAEWDEGNAQWERGLRKDWNGGGWVSNEKYRDSSPTFADWDNPRPVEKDYMPDWPEAERTHWQMYEDCTEGTPISPVMATPEELARWLYENSASAFADMTATYDQWLAMIKRGSAVSAAYDGTVSGLRSGVEAGI